jgi:hypothetical protein
MLFTGVSIVYVYNHTKLINTLCGQYSVSLNVKVLKLSGNLLYHLLKQATNLHCVHKMYL